MRKSKNIFFLQFLNYKPAAEYVYIYPFYVILFNIYPFEISEGKFSSSFGVLQSKHPAASDHTYIINKHQKARSLFHHGTPKYIIATENMPMAMAPTCVMSALNVNVNFSDSITISWHLNL